ncbi:unnamed protein product [Ostreobium quekettii]|uniref:Spondin domain-containing protein n=1 Tax=Ostreobium quekettii TaxID=121088 RepID=A0A8S1JA60_9CHLO|nr:unnamed protein product [Ostreobium quekettii]|eukprot:evm.model.scf_3746.1 EVM.evm.TU.scf_3746.1   scf_3746:4658-11076(-)
MALLRWLAVLLVGVAVLQSQVVGRSLFQDNGDDGTDDGDDDMEMPEEVEGPKESDVPCSTDVTYEVLNACDWSEDKFPRDYPSSSAHWSPLCGTAHNENYSMWDVGQISTEGVRIVAEIGDHGTLEEEVQACIDAGNCSAFYEWGCSTFSGTCDHAGTIDMSGDYPYVSLLSMIAPSPDWMTGVSSAKLCGPGGNWTSEYKRDLGGYDAGTDSGPSYTSPDDATDPFEPIFALNATDESNLLYNVDEGKLYPVCTITFTLSTDDP